MAYHKQDKVNHAIEDYTKAINLNPDYANAYSNRGVAYDSKRYFDLAIKDFNKSIQLNDRMMPTYITIVGLLTAKKMKLVALLQTIPKR